MWFQVGYDLSKRDFVVNQQLYEYFNKDLTILIIRFLKSLDWKVLKKKKLKINSSGLIDIIIGSHALLI